MNRIAASSFALLAFSVFLPPATRAQARQATRVVTISDGAADPAVSPDGSQIAVSILGKIWLVPAAGGDARQISYGITWDTHPAWSPDGQFLVYAHEDGYGSDLVVANLATGTSASLYHSDTSIGQSAFTTKGDEIYFVAQTEQLDAHIMHVPVDGGEAKSITEAHDWHEWTFALAGDAQHLLVASGRYGGANLYRIDLPGRQATRLTNTPRNQFAVSLSGDGKTIYYIESVDATDSVMSMPASGGVPHRIFSSPYDDKSLALAPDGKTAVLCAGRKLYRLDLGTGASTPIPFTARFALPPQSAGDMVITHARVWDGTGSPPQDDRTIEIKGGKIASIGAGTPNAARGVPVIDAHGRTVMPALMDNHYHFWDYSQGPMLLTRGITNIRDPGAPLSLSMSFKEAIALGLFPGPHIYSAGPLIDGLGDYHPLVDVMLDDTAQAATLVRAFKAQGVDLLKVYFMLKPDVLCAVVREAHKVGLRVTGHIGVHTSWGRAMDCGIDGLNHIRVWADFLPANEQPQGEDESLDADRNEVPRMQADWREIDPDSPRVEALIDRMRSTHVGFDPTLSIQQIDDGMRKTLGLAQFATAQDSYRRMGRFVARAQQKGVFLLAGTDDGNLFDELDAYDSVGVPNAAILQAATVNGAKWVGKDAEFGTVAVGRRADLIVVDGDPLKNIGDIRKIDIVLEDGRIVFRK
ncbi:MAG: amidohydrolase family protein [Gemmatimonadaceae bacterium]